MRFFNSTIRLVREIAFAILVAMIAFSIKIALSNTSLGAGQFRAAYGWLQHRSIAHGSGELANQLQVVDISRISRASPLDRREPVTSRIELFEAMAAIAVHNPKAIAVDVDFSLEDEGYADPAMDPAFLSWCTALSSGDSLPDGRVLPAVPVLLGVGRGSADPPGRRLGLPEFESLAAVMTRPRDRVGYMDRYVVPSTGDIAWSIAARLAQVGRDPGDKDPWSQHDWRSRIAHKEELRARGPVDVAEFPVDYGALSELKRTRFTFGHPDEIADYGARFQGRVVLLGDASAEQQADLHPVPGQEEPEPGVYHHACAAITLMHKPVYIVTHEGEFFLDILVAIVETFLVVIIVAAAARRRSELRIEHLRIVVTATLFVLAILIGTLVSPWSRVFWPGFIFVPIVLFLMSTIRELLPQLWGRVVVPWWKQWIKKPTSVP